MQSVITLLLFQSASAQNAGAEICDASAILASSRTGVPVAVLRAISLTETGRQSGGEIEPWPWTVNMEGKGVWFDDRASAQQYVDKHFDRGARSFDVGCFQLNYKWHGQAFSSVEEMFDPDANATYAARFLRDLFEEKGNWSEAAGAYHSRTPKYAQRYMKRFSRLFAKVSDLPPGTPPSPPQRSAEPATIVQVVRINRFPLLQTKSGTYASLGSLMPANAGIDQNRLFGGG